MKKNILCRIPIRNFTSQLVLCFFLSLSSSFVYGQDFFVLSENEPLQEVIYKVKEKYAIQVSANAKLLNNCLVSSIQRYANIDALLSNILQQCQLGFIKRNDVYIFRKISKKAAKNISYNYKFQCIDKTSKEALSYSNVQINNTNILSDIDGNVQFISKENQVNIKVSHLAYLPIDTNVKYTNTKITLALNSNFFDIAPVEVKTQKLANQLLVGNQPGLIKVNHVLAKQLPGNNNNTIFNILRLQPGILASGEPSKDFLIRGAYKGQSQILFDGITIFNSSSFDDRVSVFNPLVVKDVQVYKSGYQVEVGDRVGGVVDVASKNGSIDKFKLGINISNQAVGAYVNIPIKKRNSFQIAFRNVSPDIFKANSYATKSAFLDNLFTDANIKFVSHLKNNDVFKFSILGHRNSNLENEKSENNLRKYSLERNTIQYQAGASVNYRKHWKQIGNTNFLAAYSTLNTNINYTIDYIEKLNISNSETVENNIENSVSEFSVKVEHQFPSTKLQNIKLGLAYVYNQSFYGQDSIGFKLKNNNSQLSRVNFFVRDNFSFTKYLNVIVGLKTDYAIGDKLPFFQPRIQAIIKPHKYWKINAAYGIYNQFLEENTFVDRLANKIYYWNIQQSKGNRRLGAMHYVLAVSSAYKHISFSAEGYYKNTYNFDNLTNKTVLNNASSGEIYARTYGADFYVKGQLKRHMLWLAYTISKREERSLNSSTYSLSDQDQRHEFKTALILNFKPVTISANYVFGSGFMDLGTYNRLDLALTYEKKLKKLNFEIGVSVLNVTNTKNIKYSNLYNFPNNKSIYSSALEITPNLFLNLSF